jgi:hypothetical protein
MPRRLDREREAADDLVAALAPRMPEASFSTEPPPTAVASDVERVNVVMQAPWGDTIAFEIKTLARADPSRVDAMIERAPTLPADTLSVLIADQIPEMSRTRLERAGWGYLDRRGHLRISNPSARIFLDVDVAPTTRAGTPPQQPIRGASGISYAAALLMTPDEPPSVREVARRAHISFSTVADAGRAIRRAALVGRDGRPLIPDLFWALSDVWQPERVPLLGQPMPEEHATMDALGVLGERTEPGWAVTGDLAAVAYGAPLTVGSGSPPDFYVPNRLTAANAARTYGVAPDLSLARCSVAVAPTLLACAPRFEPGGRAAHFLEFFLTHPLFVALDLAADKARGVEILADWRPQGFARVW